MSSTAPLIVFGDVSDVRQAALEFPEASVVLAAEEHHADGLLEQVRFHLEATERG